MPDRVEVIQEMFVNAVGPKMTDDQKNELIELINNDSLSKHELNVKIKELCKESGDEVMKKYSDIINTFVLNETKILKKLKNVGDRFTPETRVLLQDATKVYTNQSISYRKESEQLQDLFDNATTEIKAELKLFGEPFTYISRNFNN
uniref:Uncharacterized protein n=1 Tax=Panagrolaimus sp. PS1159 TaxID=55785 RepID=A0AC35FGN3_9BILA